MKTTTNPINRRNFLTALTGIASVSLLSVPFQKMYGSPLNHLSPGEAYDFQFRPHHILDIVTDYGKGTTTYQPHPYGHSLHIVAPKLLAGTGQKIKLILAADDVCKGCNHLLPDGKCNDVLSQLKPSPAKQSYNDVLDSRIFDLLAIEPGTILTFREYLVKVNEHTPGIEYICTHPKEKMDERLSGLINGLIKLGVRSAEKSEK